jgi:hypothetical protein
VLWWRHAIACDDKSYDRCERDALVGWGQSRDLFERFDPLRHQSLIFNVSKVAGRRIFRENPKREALAE